MDLSYKIKNEDKIPFVQNRLIIFDANKLHRGLSPNKNDPTDKKSIDVHVGGNCQHPVMQNYMKYILSNRQKHHKYFYDFFIQQNFHTKKLLQDFTKRSPACRRKSSCCKKSCWSKHRYTN